MLGKFIMKLTPPLLQELISEYSSVLPEGAKDRIIIDKTSGLAYPLFGSYFLSPDSSRKEVVIPLEIGRGKLNSVVMYSTVMQNYVDDAEQHARDYGFDLVYISAKKLISLDFDHNHTSMCRTGVGKTSITSSRKVAQFCQMIKSGHDRFEDRYKKIRELAEKLSL